MELKDIEVGKEFLLTDEELPSLYLQNDKGIFLDWNSVEGLVDKGLTGVFDMVFIDRTSKWKSNPHEAKPGYNPADGNMDKPTPTPKYASVQFVQVIDEIIKPYTKWIQPFNFLDGVIAVKGDGRYEVIEIGGLGKGGSGEEVGTGVIRKYRMHWKSSRKMYSIVMGDYKFLNWNKLPWEVKQ